jgi:hypothetical protein
MAAAGASTGPPMTATALVTAEQAGEISSSYGHHRPARRLVVGCDGRRRRLIRR